MTPRTRSFADFDRPYRRGVILGLSLAEVFLILLFLLLLTITGYSAVVEDEMDEARAKFEQLLREKSDAEARAMAADGERDALAAKLGTEEKARKILEAKLDKAEGARDALAVKVAETKEALHNIIGPEGPLGLIAGLQEKVEALQAERDKLTPNAKLGNEVRVAAVKAGISPSDVPEAVSGAVQAQGTIMGLKSQLVDAKVEGKELRDKLRTVIEDKGQYPPCWYKTVPRSNGKSRERPLYIFDVRISDNGIFVKNIPAPTPEYASKKPKLPFDRSALNKSIGFDKFLKSFQPLKNAAEKGRVQVYPCKFFVRVWDTTTSKETYQHALEDVVETVFFKYLVKRKPWPH